MGTFSSTCTGTGMVRRYEILEKLGYGYDGVFFNYIFLCIYF